MKRNLALVLSAAVLTSAMSINVFAGRTANNKSTATTEETTVVETVEVTEETTAVEEETEETTAAAEDETVAAEDETAAVEDETVAAEDETAAVEEETEETTVAVEEATEETTVEEAEATDEISIVVNGTKLETEEPAVIKNARTLVPVRFIAEAIGVAVDWDAETKTAVFENDGVTAKLEIGASVVVITKGETSVEVEIDQPAEIINDRTMVPVRFISETFGCDVDWDEATRTVSITSEAVVVEETTEATTEVSTEETTAEDATAEATEETTAEDATAEATEETTAAEEATEEATAEEATEETTVEETTAAEIVEE